MSYPRRLSIEELEQDKFAAWNLGKLGSFVLKDALADHLDSTYPEAPGKLLSDLLEANLSRHNLTRVAERLESAGLILFWKVRDDGKDYEQQYEDKLRLDMGDYGYCMAGAMRVASNYDMHSYWEDRVRLEDTVKETKRVRSNELGQGFRAGMYNYAMQVAGIMYVESKYDLEKFWKKYKEHLEPIINPEDLENQQVKYKEHLEPIISPEDLENQQVAAGEFEAEMKSVV